MKNVFLLIFQFDFWVLLSIQSRIVNPEILWSSWKCSGPLERSFLLLWSSSLTVCYHQGLNTAHTHTSNLLTSGNICRDCVHTYTLWWCGTVVDEVDCYSLAFLALIMDGITSKWKLKTSASDDEKPVMWLLRFLRRQTSCSAFSQDVLLFWLEFPASAGSSCQLSVRFERFS